VLRSWLRRLPVSEHTPRCGEDIGPTSRGVGKGGGVVRSPGVADSMAEAKKKDIKFKKMRFLVS
jgi:hypothetical protein